MKFKSFTVSGLTDKLMQSKKLEKVNVDSDN